VLQTSLLFGHKGGFLMIDTTAGGDLPTPAQMRSFYEVSQAAWHARRMREASRAVITGNIALGLCVLGAMLVVMHSQWVRDVSIFVMAGLIWGYLIGLFFTIRWIKRQRARSLVTVIDRREEEARKAVAQPRRLAALLFVAYVFQALCAIGWGIAFRHMSNSAILASLAISPVIGMLYFVRRFVQFRFWEDLLFAGSVALAFAPMFLRTWDLTPLSFLALLLVIAGTVSLHFRWVTWTRSLADIGSEDAPEEVQS
jgi:hypothetical protein